MSERRFELVLLGATGFAGRLVAEYLQDRIQGPWAIAGRSRAKLEAIAATLATPVEILVVDTADSAALAELAAQTRVICTTVGPYAKHGAPVVAACVANGTHYCDLTGEPQFIRQMIDAHHSAAVAAGVRIVHCCGFDSIPSDLGTLLVQHTAIEADGTPCDEVEYVLRWANGGFSGGTIASLVNVLEEASDPATRRVLADPYSLAGEPGPDGREQLGVRYSEAAGAWTGPFLMAAVNERVVRRSNALSGYRYGREFRYGESMQLGRGWSGRLKAWGLTVGLGAFAGLMTVGPVRRQLLKRVLPAPGEGPSTEAIENGGFGVRLYGKRGGRTVVTVDVVGRKDPGYGGTACMLGESALLLASGAPLGPPGVGTPASCLGLPLIDRLDASLIRFSASREQGG